MTVPWERMIIYSNLTVEAIHYGNWMSDYPYKEKVFHGHIPKSILFRHTHMKSTKLKEDKTK